MKHWSFIAPPLPALSVSLSLVPWALKFLTTHLTSSLFYKHLHYLYYGDLGLFDPFFLSGRPFFLTRSPYASSVSRLIFIDTTTLGRLVHNNGAISGFCQFLFTLFTFPDFFWDILIVKTLLPNCKCLRLYSLLILPLKWDWGNLLCAPSNISLFAAAIVSFRDFLCPRKIATRRILMWLQALL